MKFYTYLHCKPNGDPFYVGKGVGKRATLLTSRSTHHKNIVAKYGAKNIDIFIFPRLSERDALETECRWIAQFKREGIKLCNQTDGGEGISGYNHSAEARAKISAARVVSKASPEARANNSAARIGKPLTPETRAKISATTTGRKKSPCSAEHRAKIGAANTGRKASDATKAKMRASQTGRKMSPESIEKTRAANTGKKHSPERCAAMRAAQLLYFANKRLAAQER